MPTDATITRYGSTGANQGFAIVVRPDGPWVRYEDHQRALAAAHAARDAAERAKRVTFCHFCLVKVDVNGMTPPEALDALKAHSLTCPESPIAAALTTALRERDEARAAIAAYQAEHERRRP